MNTQRNIIMNACIIGLVFCTILGMIAVTLNMVALYRLAFFGFSCIYTFSIRKYKTEEHEYKWIRKNLKAYIWILIAIALIGLLNTYTEWIATETFLRIIRTCTVILFPIEAVYLTKVKNT